MAAYHPDSDITLFKDLISIRYFRNVGPRSGTNPDAALTPQTTEVLHKTMAELGKHREEIGQFLSRFFGGLDSRNYEIVASGFAENGAWMRQGTQLVGPVQVMEALKARPLDFVTAHIISNLHVEKHDTTTYGAQFMSLVFAAHGVAEGSVPGAVPTQVARYEARIEGEGDKMRITSLKSTVLFKN